MKITNFEKGQTIVIIALTMVGLIAMAALIIDGSNAYLNRRRAQTAADAAAFAGVSYWCMTENPSSTGLTDVIDEYATIQNHATYVDYTLEADGELVVTAEITAKTFFAKVFNKPESVVNAVAAANCFPPGAADSVLPIAWSCRPPLPGMVSDSDDCEWKSIPWNVMKEIINHVDYDPYTKILYHEDGDATLGIPPEPETAEAYLNGIGDLQLYIVMDSIASSSEIPCIQTDPVNGTIDCDLDADGRIDILGNGDRSWLILDGDSNNAQLDDIVRGELEFGISAPTWYPGRDGAIADVYKDAANFVEGEPALIPVFNAICAPTSDPLLDPDCVDVVEAGDGLVQINTAESGTYFRVVSFAEFYVSCVSNKPSKICPGKEMAISLGIVDHNTPSIEGYFVDGWVAGDTTIATGSNVLDLGIYVISLTQ